MSPSSSSMLYHLVPSVSTFLTAIAILLVSSFLYLSYKTLIRPLSQLRNIPSPPLQSYILGNLPRIIADPPGVPHREWALQHPGAFKYQGFLGETRLCITDPVGLSYVLVKEGYKYPKPQEVRGDLARILGKGLLFAEGEDHKRQKRIMSPAFSPSALKQLTPIFIEQSNLLRDKWLEMIEKGQSEELAFANKEQFNEYKKGEEGIVVLEITKWLSRLTLDIIGLAGFGYSFGALSQQRNNLAEAFQTMLSGGGGVQKKKMPVSQLIIGRLVGRLASALPIFDLVKWVPNKRIQAVRKGFETMEVESKKILKEKKKLVEEGGVDVLGGGKDLMTLLLKSNMGETKSTMTDTELQGQMTTFILAGHETTSTALTWLLYHLSFRPEMQSRLRKEIRQAKSKAKSEDARDELNADELNGLTYLDAVCREILRFEPPVSVTIRSAAEDDSIPLSKPIVGSNGQKMSSLPVTAGQILVIAIAAVNFNPEIFGNDVNEFKPERWLKEEGVEGNVGVYSNMLTFLAGPRACIGYKFSLLELKA